MKFPKEDLIDLVYDDAPEDYEVVETKITDTTRWSILYSQVFKYKGKFYRTSWSKGATECQEEALYEYEKDTIELPEVFPVEKVITVYE